MTDPTTQNSSQLLIYQSEDGITRLEVQLHEETVWLSQKHMAELFQTTVPNINLHLKNIFAEGELMPKATIKDFLIVQTEGSRQGYKVKENDSAGPDGGIDLVIRKEVKKISGTV